MPRAEITGRKPLASIDHDEADAQSIATFCQRHGISESFFHKLQARGLGPKTMQVGRRTLISAEAAARWRRQREGAASAPAA